MPSIHELKKTLGLAPGEACGNEFVVHEIKTAMDEKKHRELYNFKVHLWLQPTGGRKPRHLGDNQLEKAKAALIDLVKEREIMYSSYGSPYEVHLEHVRADRASNPNTEQFGEGETGQLVEIQALAVAKRRRDLPRLSEQHASNTSSDEKEAADDEVKRQGYRVVKAHFKSSHCPLCGKEFIPGEHIAKPNGDKSRGGWAHTTCLAHQMEAEAMKQGGGGGGE